MFQCPRCQARCEDLLDCWCGKYPIDHGVCESCFEEHDCPAYPPKAIRNGVAAIRSHPDPEVARCFAYVQGLKALEVLADALENLYGSHTATDETVERAARLLQGASPPKGEIRE